MKALLVKDDAKVLDYQVRSLKWRNQVSNADLLTNRNNGYFCKKSMGIADKLFQMNKDKADSNLKAGQDFLEANSKKPGVVTLPSGLQYEVLAEGTGKKPLASNKVTCHYHGTLIDGTVFDSSVKRGQPATFPLNMVIKGWTEGLQLMSEGSKWRFFIPANLGYGDRQVSAQIGANSTLIFDVELLGIS